MGEWIAIQGLPQIRGPHIFMVFKLGCRKNIIFMFTYIN